MNIQIFHYPKCSTSRKALEILVSEGFAPEIIEYAKLGWHKEQLISLLQEAGLNVFEVLRIRQASDALKEKIEAKQISEDDLLDLMVDDPILVERPIVKTPNGVRLCRPIDKIYEILP